MVMISFTSGRSGFYEWLLQRITAIILCGYTIFIFSFFFLQPHHDYHSWVRFFNNIWTRYATFLVILATVIHAWIGVWTVITDYIKHTAIRLCTQVIVNIILLFYLVWGWLILWR